MAKQTRTTRSTDAAAPEGKAHRREAARLDRARKKVESALKDARAELGRRHRQVSKAEAGIAALEARLAKAIAAHTGSGAPNLPAVVEKAVAGVKSVAAKPAPKVSAKPAAAHKARRQGQRPSQRLQRRATAKPPWPSRRLKAAATTKPATKPAAAKAGREAKPERRDYSSHRRPSHDRPKRDRAAQPEGAPGRHRWERIVRRVMSVTRPSRRPASRRPAVASPR